MTKKAKAKKLAHLLLQVSDLERAEDFYIGTLGFDRKPDAVPLGDGRPLTVTLQGLGLTIGGPGDQQQLAERAKASDVKVVKDLGPGAYGLTIYLSDPDGNTIELFETV